MKSAWTSLPLKTKERLKVRFWDVGLSDPRGEAFNILADVTKLPSTVLNSPAVFPAHVAAPFLSHSSYAS